MKYLKILLISFCFILLGNCVVFAQNTNILPESATRNYTKDEVKDFSLQALCYAKNEIYARKGRKFDSVELQQYFATQEWYQGTIDPKSFDESVFNEFEKANAYMLAEVEHEKDPNGYALDKEGYDINAVIGIEVTAQGPNVTGTETEAEVQQSPAPVQLPTQVQEQPQQVQTQTQEQSSIVYDILDGLQVLRTSDIVSFDSKYITLNIPNTLKCAYGQQDKTTIKLFSTDAKMAGLGGEVVTIKAYSINDEAYKTLESAKILGYNSYAVYVAIYPTTLQYNPKDVEVSKNYINLLSWAYDLADGAHNYFVLK